LSSTATALRLASVVLVAAIALALTISPPAHAGLGLACPDATSQVFRSWGDAANYALVPDGGFEAGASGWALTGDARVVAGNEPYHLHASADSSSLRLAAGATTTSPQMCIGLLSSKMRFVLGGTAGSTVRVQVIYRGPLSSVLGIFDGGTAKTSGTWAPSPELSMLGGFLPLLTQSVQFRFVALSGAVMIDDVYLDPWKKT
jgi:hypothetical protein